MKIDTNKLNVSKKHLIAIAVIVATGVVLGSAILGGKATKTAEDDGHGHGKIGRASCRERVSSPV